MNILDKEEFRIKLEEINRLVEKKDYKSAMSVVDSIDWRRVKNVRTLCVVGEIYAANKRYEDSKNIFLLAYHRAPIGKNILYRLVEVSLKMGDIEEAMEFYEEYVEVAPNDHTQYILKYKIDKAKKVPEEELIKILETYKNKEFTEKWSYELAKLYYKAGMRDECLRLCDEMILWFNDGKYVMRAMELKLRLGELKGEEKEKYDQQFKPNLVSPEELKEIKANEENAEAAKENIFAEKVPVIESIRMDERDINNAESLQEKISKGLRDIFGNMKKEKDESEEESLSENDEIPEEMVKDIKKKETYVDVPDLEPERFSTRVNGAVEIKEEKNPAETLKAKKLEIPPAMKNIEIPEPVKEPAEMEETAEEPKEEIKKDFDFDFNLEDTILAAATAQGIEIPKEPEVKEEPKKTEEKVLEEEEDFSEEDLRLAEEEFLKGPSKTMDLEETEEEAPETAEETEKPADMETSVFNFQQEIKKILGDEEEDTQIGTPEDVLSDELAEDFPELRELEETEEELTEEEELEKFIDSIQPESQRAQNEVAVRSEKLTDEEIKLFTYFVKVPGMKEQLIDTLYDTQLSAADKTSKTGNIIVMGGKETGKTRLIAALIPAICKELKIEASKVAYVFAEQINGKNIAKIVDKLAGGFLVIENANQLSQQTAEELNNAMELRTDGLTVIVEDEKIGMRKFIAKYPKLAKKFTSMINIPVFTNDELVAFAEIYAADNGYTIDQMGMLALYDSISVNQKQDEPMNIGVVKNLIDAAIAKSKGGFLKINKKKADASGLLVLTEKDFN